MNSYGTPEKCGYDILEWKKFLRVGIYVRGYLAGTLDSYSLRAHLNAKCGFIH